MNIENLTDIFQSNVVSNRPDLSDFNQGSVLYTLARAVAATSLEVYNELDNLKSSGLILDANLSDEVVTSLNESLGRVQGSTATGYVLASNLNSIDRVLEVDTILTDPVSLTQYRIASETSITVSPLIEKKVAIVAAEVGNDYNLPAGRTLISPNFPRISFIVGAYRDIDDTPKGSLTGGVSIEDDETYFTRIKTRLLNDRVGQRQALINQLESQDAVISAEVENLRGGLSRIWVTSATTLTATQLDTLNESIQTYVPVGIYTEVKQRSEIFITVRLHSYEEINLTIENFIISLVTDYIEALNTVTLTTAAIRNLISDRTGIVMKVVDPLGTVTLNEGETFKVNKVEVTYAT